MRPTQLYVGRRPVRPVGGQAARTPRIAPAKKGAASPGAMSATGPANIGWRPSVLSAMILPVGPLVTAATARAPPANAAPIGVRIGLASAVDQRPKDRKSTRLNSSH